MRLFLYPARLFSMPILLVPSGLVTPFLRLRYVLHTFPHPWLALCDPSLVPVHQGGDRIPPSLLEVALSEHLLLEQEDPFAVNVVRAREVT